MGISHEAHVINVNVKPTSESHYVGQCLEFPSIIVQANTIQKVKTKTLQAVLGYLKTFPEEHDVLVNKQETHQIKVSA